MPGLRHCLGCVCPISHRCRLQVGELSAVVSSQLVFRNFSPTDVFFFVSVFKAKEQMICNQ